MKTLYTAEVTDTFGGDANYCWVRRYTIKAKSALGAIQVLSRHEGLSFRKEYDGRYNAVGACICAFVQEADDYDLEAHDYVSLSGEVTA